MKKPINKKALIVMAVLGVVALVVFFLVKKKKSVTTTPKNETPPINTVYNEKTQSFETLTPQTLDIKLFPLKKGSKGDYVTILQNWLQTKNPAYLPRYGVDGEYGTETETAVMAVLGTNTVSYEQFKTKVIAFD